MKSRPLNYAELMGLRAAGSIAASLGVLYGLWWLADKAMQVMS